ncbi:DUF6585 family protein [Undibacterium sp. Di27W]|uniref:DUF6585 family protein n=1 Tax=Undibacterium sp. Di27W TaxID=3413036 RepID=UPI003BF0BB9C
MNQRLIHLLSACLLVLCCLLTTNANASGVRTQHEIDWVADTRAQVNEGEALYLGRHLRSEVFFLPYYIADEGYVLGVKGSRTDYHPLPPERVAELQASGMLPNPLPDYHLRLIDLAIGNALWLPILAGFLYLLLRQAQALHARKLHCAVTFSEAAMGPWLASYKKNWALSTKHLRLFMLACLPLGLGWIINSLPLLLMGMLLQAPFILLLISQFAYRIDLYEKGMVILGPLEAGLLYFSPASSIREIHTCYSSNKTDIFSGRLNDSVMVEDLQDGKKIQLCIPSNIANMQDLLQRLRHLQVSYLLPHFIAQHQLGATLDFSGLKIRKSQLMTTKQVINATDIDSIELKNTLLDVLLVIRQKQSKKDFYRVRMANTTNFHVLLALLNLYFKPETKPAAK